MKIHPLWRNYILTTLLIIALFCGAAVGWTTLNRPITEKKTYNAELIEAYEFGDHCGSKGRDTCTAFMGRFRENETGKIFDQETNGFFYHRFVDQGRKPLPAYLQLSREDFGAKTPFLGDFFGFMNFLIFVIGGTYIIIHPWGIPDERERYDRWNQREKEKRIGFPTRR